MPHGSGQVIRQAMMYAKPWQRYVIAGAMLAAGAALVAVSHVAGVVLAGAGALLLWRMLPYRVRWRHQTQRLVDTEEVGRSGGVPDSSAQ
jgi:hypothetical protein